MTYGHGGDIYRNRILCDFSVNLNPSGMPDGVRKALVSSVDRWSVYPDSECADLRAGLEQRLGIPAETILCGNGAAELLYVLAQVLRPDGALIPAPTFTEYEAALRTTGCRIRFFPLEEKKNFRPDIRSYAEAVTGDAELVFLCNPNNPNGLAVPSGEVLSLAESCKKKGARLVVDECFTELLEEPGRASLLSGLAKERRELLKEFPNLVILRAFTKSFALAGLRLGYAVSGDLALLSALRAARQPWSVSVPAQIAGKAALSVSEGYLKQARRVIAAGRRQLSSGLSAFGFTPFPSDANYLLFSAPQPDLKERCLKKGILIRSCADYRGLPEGKNFYRVCVKKPEENRLLLDTLGSIL